MSAKTSLNRLAQLLEADPSDDNAMRQMLASMVLSPVKAVKHRIRTLSTGEKDTGVDLPTSGVVLDCFLVVATAEATASTKTIDVGLLASETGGDADGFLDGAVTSATGGVRGTATATDGTNQNYFAANPTLGALLRTGSLGTDAAGEAAALLKTPHVLNGTAKSLSYTLGSAHTELVADIVVVYIDFGEI